ncbi:MAG: HNH endonuclease, partial [Myxococcota bacterium]
MAPVERDKLVRSTLHLKQRQYFDLAERAARHERARVEAILRKSPDSRKARQRLARARTIEDAAAVKPVAGALPRNHIYAGKLYPVGNIDPRRRDAIAAIAAKRRAGVRFTRQGYPDFGPWIHRKGRIKADVRIRYTGNRPGDFRAADRAMREKLGDPRWTRPDGYTWHHHEEVGRMVLVPEDL